MTIQITSEEEEIVVLNLNSTDNQLNVLDKIVDYLGERKKLFSADICDEKNILNVVADHPKSSWQFGLEKNEFKNKLKSSLKSLKDNKSK